MSFQDSQTTPMMRQYLTIKEKYKDAILFYRLGDFYEMFFEDAKVASKMLDLTLTTRNKNERESVPLCGVPYHSAPSYIHKLLENGQKVAICEQVEDPKTAKGIVKREVVQVFSPGCVLDPQCLDGKTTNYLASVIINDKNWGLALSDISTGSFKLSEGSDVEKLKNEILRLEPKEILVLQTHYDFIQNLSKQLTSIRINITPAWCFDEDFCKELFESTFKVKIEGLNLEKHPLSMLAGGALLSFLKETKFLDKNLLDRPQFYSYSDSMILDDNAKKNLELIKTLNNNQRNGSLIWHLDQAMTPMGSRQISEWLMYPLLNIQKIEERYSAIKEMIQKKDFLDNLRLKLKSVSDLERIQNRILAGFANARDMLALKNSLQIVPELIEDLNLVSNELMNSIKNQLNPLTQLSHQIDETLKEEAPLSLKDGQLIKHGFNPELDELREIERNGKSYISNLEVKEREKTQITSLKIRYNKVFGYYIEITNVHKDKVPNHYIRKQTLANAERYITEELKNYEEKVLGASERIKNLEFELFDHLRKTAAEFSETIKKNAQQLAILDALLSLACVSFENQYVCPELTQENKLHIIKGRHPLVEILNKEEPFIPNDIILDEDSGQLMIITGPNMAGKSTVMRQTALIVLMAQMGCFVPAQSAVIGIVDQIFTRIGANDFLQKGQSTFMVEMLETSHILNQATIKSLIILDEIGRGTSTFDGLSIAWAVCERIHDDIKARCLFATHYHELTDLADEKKGIVNYHVAAKIYNDEILFLRDLKKGSTNRSYGVYVASMAGLPEATIKRAKEILNLLEEKDLSFKNKATHLICQPTLFETPTNPVINELKNLNLDEISPLKALNILSDVQKKIKK